MAIDIIARGLATAEVARQKRLRVLNTLRASIAKADFTLPVLASPLPTIGAPLAASAIDTGTTWQVATGGNPLHAAKFTFVGGAWQCPAGTFPNTEFYKAITSRVGNGTTLCSTRNKAPVRGFASPALRQASSFTSRCPQQVSAAAFG